MSDPRDPRGAPAARDATDGDPLAGVDTAAAAVPPMGAALEAALVDLTPVPPRRPWRQAAVVLAGSLVWALLILGVLRVRPDLADLPRGWLVAYLAAWMAGFVVPVVLLLVPRRGSMMPRWPMAAAIGALAGIGFVVAGLVLARSAATSRPDAGHGHLCMLNGLVTALAPTLLGVLALRGAIPNASRTVAAALGAAAGCIGGFGLHLHCPISDPLHVGLAHGGVVLVAAALAGLIAPRWLAVR